MMANQCRAARRRARLPDGLVSGTSDDMTRTVVAVSRQGETLDRSATQGRMTRRACLDDESGRPRREQGGPINYSDAGWADLVPASVRSASAVASTTPFANQRIQPFDLRFSSAPNAANENKRPSRFVRDEEAMRPG